jgi:16S rRNA (cytidine1402-2'-O)-methyltransferase
MEEKNTNQKFSYKSTLFIVPTPIGNLEDITLRALNILKNVDIIACEDTRHTLKLLNHFNIKNRLFSYHKFTQFSKEDYLIELLKEGKNIALVSNAGMPALADPGFFLIKKAIANSLSLVVLPGASSVINAFVYSNLHIESFVFAGWMPKKPGERKRTLEKYLGLEIPVVFLDSPHRIIKTLEDLALNYPNIKAVIAREISKLHEEIYRGTVQETLALLKTKPPKGEIIIILQNSLNTK